MVDAHNDYDDSWTLSSSNLAGEGCSVQMATEEPMDVSQTGETKTTQGDNVETIVPEQVFNTLSDSEGEFDSDGLENIINEDVESSGHDTHRDTLGRVLFVQSNITELDILTMVHTLSVRHSLTKVAVQDILDLIKVCAKAPQENMLNNYYLDKQCKGNPINYNYYCVQCKAPLVTRHTVPHNELVICTNTNCYHRNVLNAKSSHYITTDIKQQLTPLIEKYPDVGRRGSSSVDDPAVICDVFDGSMYRHLKSQCKFQFTYNFNIDGAPIFAASKRSMWPIQLLVNELPPIDRFRNPLLAGIWVGTHEPDVALMNTIVESFAKQAQQLFRDGVCVKNKIYNGLPFACVVDSVARPIIQNRLQYNGYYGCSWCYHEGKIIGRTVKYPMDIQHELRSKESHLEDVLQVQANRYQNPVRGVKGPSTTLLLPHFDPIWSFPLEYMHSILLGVVRQMWELWTINTQKKDCAFKITRDNLAIINQRLRTIQPPQEIHRLPRDITTTKWKASEWKSWLLYYSIPCLAGILNQQYLSHVSHLVAGVYMLLQETISETQLAEAQDHITEFVYTVEELYGTEAMTFNMHSLLHVGDSVRKTGPLWATSAFPFESEVYTVKQQIKGPASIAAQVARKMVAVNICKSTVTTDARLSIACKQYCSEILATTRRLQRCTQVNNVTMLGTPIAINALDLAMPSSDDALTTLQRFTACIYNNHLFRSAHYERSVRRMDSCVQTHEGEFLHVCDIIVRNYETVVVYGVKIDVQPVRCEGVELPHMFEAQLSNTPVTCRVEDICKCILIAFENSTYISTFPNTFEVQ